MNEHYKLMEKSLEQLKNRLGVSLTDNYRINMERALTHDEYGLALEYLLDSLDESQSEISKETFDQINNCVSAMGLSWDYLPKISNLVK